VRRLLSNYRGYAAHVVRVQMVTCREVQQQQRDTFTRAQNVCFLTNPNLGRLFKATIEGIVLKDIQDKKAAAMEFEKAASDSRKQRINSISAGGNRKNSSHPPLANSVSAPASKGPESDSHSTTADGNGNSNMFGSSMSRRSNALKESQSETKRKKSVRISEPAAS
jgi:hypothetical protein